VNAEVVPARLREVAALDPEATALTRSAVERLGLSARAYDRLLRVALTVADLEGSDRIASRHVAEALQFRGLREPVTLA
jgi:magnesium chelatase family protein